MSNQLLPELFREQLARLDKKRLAFARLAVRTAESLQDRLRVELTYASNALEGNTLSLRETQLVVEEGLAPGQGRTLREVYEARNHFAAVKVVEAWVKAGRKIGATDVLELHGTVMR